MPRKECRDVAHSVFVGVAATLVVIRAPCCLARRLEWGYGGQNRDADVGTLIDPAVCQVLN
jgi:hypothetical protein